MAEYEKKVRDILSNNGCYMLRHGKGDHDIWINPNNDKQTTVATKIKSRYTANSIMKQLGIKYHFQSRIVWLYREGYSQAEELGIDPMAFDGDEKALENRDVRKAVVLLATGKSILQELRERLMARKRKLAL